MSIEDILWLWARVNVDGSVWLLDSAELVPVVSVEDSQFDCGFRGWSWGDDELEADVDVMIGYPGESLSAGNETEPGPVEHGERRDDVGVHVRQVVDVDMPARRDRISDPART